MFTTVAVFGAGIAGLCAAHELARRGYRVSVYEATEHPGGFFRSDRQPHHANMPSEYSWHGMLLALAGVLVLLGFLLWVVPGKETIPEPSEVG